MKNEINKINFFFMVFQMKIPLKLSLLVIIIFCSYFRAIFWAGTYFKVEPRDAYSENAPLLRHYPIHIMSLMETYKSRTM
jgi:hypothetical protein